MCREHSIRQKVTKLGLGPSVHDAMDDAVQVVTRVDVVRDARGDDRQDIAGPLAALVEPREEPIPTSQDQASELAFSAVIGGFDISVFEKEPEARPLAVQVTEAFAQWRLGRNGGLLQINPRAKLVEDGSRAAITSLASLLGGIAGTRRFALDREQAGDDEPLPRGGASRGPSTLGAFLRCVRESS